MKRSRFNEEQIIAILKEAANLPTVRWKLQNLEKLKKNNPDKNAEQRTLIEGLAG